MKLLSPKIIFFLSLVCVMPLYGETVVEDGGVAISDEELQQIVKTWTAEMRNAAANSEGSRFELLSLAMASKKAALDAQAVSHDEDPDFYWERELQVRAVLRYLLVKRYMSSLQLPDFKPLARERYLADKDKYALVPEQRMTSQILFSCQPNACDIDKVNATATQVLEKLQSGADFEELVAQYSDDPGTKQHGGKFDRWISKGEPHVVPQYTDATFEIAEVGAYSPLVSSQYGLHIIRLDELKQPHYKSYEEVEPILVQQLEQEYRKLAAMEFDLRYKMSDDAFFNDALIDEIFAPYKNVEDSAGGSTAPQGASPSQ